jgi:hypothetical protein
VATRCLEVMLRRLNWYGDRWMLRLYDVEGDVGQMLVDMRIKWLWQAHDFFGVEK